MAEEKKAAVKPAVEKVAAEAKKAAEAVTAAAAEAAGTAKEAAKEVTKKKTTRRTSTRKTTSRAPRAKKSEIKESVSIQYAGKDITAASLIEKAKEIWTKDLGKKEADLKTVNVYVKTEENRAYYVMNETEVGSFEI